MESPRRVYFYDNLKFILITLVVIGHFVQFNLSYDLLKGIFLFIYLFHMPLFILVAGYFSKKIINSDSSKRLNKILIYFLLYLLYKMLLFFILNFLFDQPYTFQLFTEAEPPWYLLACVVWIVFVNLFKNIKPAYMMAVSILICLFIGYDSSIVDQFALSRVFVFMPFFLFGYYITKDRMNLLVNKLHEKQIAIPLIILFCIILFVFVYFANELYFLRPLLTARNPYEFVSFPIDLPMTGAIFRLGVLILCCIVSAALISLTPRRKMFFTTLGSRTLQIYVLHFLVVALLGYSGIITILANVFGAWFPLIIIIMSIILVFSLSVKFFEKPFLKIFQINFNRFYSK